MKFSNKINNDIISPKNTQKKPQQSMPLWYQIKEVYLYEDVHEIGATPRTNNKNDINLNNRAKKKTNLKTKKIIGKYYLEFIFTING